MKVCCLGFMKEINLSVFPMYPWETDRFLLDKNWWEIRSEKPLVCSPYSTRTIEYCPWCGEKLKEWGFGETKRHKKPKTDKSPR